MTQAKINEQRKYSNFFPAQFFSVTELSMFGTLCLHGDVDFTSLKPKFHLARHVTSVHDTFDVTSPCILAVSILSNSTAWHARLDALDTSNMSCCVETWR